MWAIFALIALFLAGYSEAIGQKCDSFSYPSHFNIDQFGRPMISCSKTQCFPRYAISKCDKKFSRRLCKEPHLFTTKSQLSNSATLMSKCCEFSRLKNGDSMVMSVSVRAGKQYSGGEVMDNGNLAYFNFIKDIRLVPTADGSVEYMLNVYQIPCEQLGFSYASTYQASEGEPLAEAQPYYQSHKKVQQRQVKAQPQQQNSHHGQMQPHYKSSKRQTYQVPSENQAYPQQSPQAEPQYGVEMQDRAYQMSNVQTPPLAVPVDNQQNMQLVPLSPVPDSATALPPPQPISSTPHPLFGPFTLAPITGGAAAQPPHMPPPGMASHLLPPVLEPHGRPRIHQAPTYTGQTDCEQQRQYYQSYYDWYRQCGQYSGRYYANEGGSTVQCFSGDMVVQTPTGMKAMRDLQVGDSVLASVDQTMSFLPVVMFLHRVDDQWAEFYRIETSTGDVLELTADHALYENNCEDEQSHLIYAKNVHPGKCVIVVNEDIELTSTIVRNVEKVQRQGFYAPLTATGAIIVNNVLASCYCNLLLPSVHQTFFNMLQKLSDFVGMIVPSMIISSQHLPLGVESIMGVFQDLFPSSYI